MTFRVIPRQPGIAGHSSLNLPAAPSGVAGLFGSSLVEFIRDMHGVDVVWKPAFEGQEVPW